MQTLCKSDECLLGIVFLCFGLPVGPDEMFFLLIFLGHFFLPTFSGFFHRRSYLLAPLFTRRFYFVDRPLAALPIYETVSPKVARWQPAVAAGDTLRATLHSPK